MRFSSFHLLLPAVLMTVSSMVAAEMQCYHGFQPAKAEASNVHLSDCSKGAECCVKVTIGEFGTRYRCARKRLCNHAKIGECELLGNAGKRQRNRCVCRSADDQLCMPESMRTTTVAPVLPSIEQPNAVASHPCNVKCPMPPIRDQFNIGRVTVAQSDVNPNACTFTCQIPESNNLLHVFHSDVNGNETTMGFSIGCLETVMATDLMCNDDHSWTQLQVINGKIREENKDAKVNALFCVGYTRAKVLQCLFRKGK